MPTDPAPEKVAALAAALAGDVDDRGLGCSEYVIRRGGVSGACGREAHAFVAPSYATDSEDGDNLCKLHTTLAVKNGGRLIRLVDDEDRRAAERSRWDFGYAKSLGTATRALGRLETAGWRLTRPPDDADAVAALQEIIDWPGATLVATELIAALNAAGYDVARIEEGERLRAALDKWKALAAWGDADWAALQDNPRTAASMVRHLYETLATLAASDEAAGHA